MKKLLVVTAVALALGFTACKKSDPQKPQAVGPVPGGKSSTAMVDGSSGRDMDIAKDSRKEMLQSVIPNEPDIRRAGKGEAEEKSVEKAADEAPSAPDGNAPSYDPGIVGHFYAAMELSKDRLLEYNVSLKYRCKDLQQSRLLLLAIASKYGFSRSSSTSIAADKQSLNAVIAVRSDRLYEALRECDGLGRLENENIFVKDYTGDMAFQDRKAKREQTRSQRRSRALDMGATKERTWKEVEDHLSASEDAMDDAEHRKWTIKDSVAWATVNINLMGPESHDQIEVPRYTNALVGFVNFLLGLLYVLLWTAPLLIAAGIVIWKRKKIAALFKRGKKEKAEQTEKEG